RHGTVPRSVRGPQVLPVLHPGARAPRQGSRQGEDLAALARGAAIRGSGPQLPCAHEPGGTQGRDGGMNLQNIQWKLHLDESTVGNPHDWFKAFGTWIPDSPEVFVDVADYSHVQDGPVIFLSGHNECYSLDATGRR